MVGFVGSMLLGLDIARATAQAFYLCPTRFFTAMTEYGDHHVCAQLIFTTWSPPTRRRVPALIIFSVLDSVSYWKCEYDQWGGGWRMAPECKLFLLFVVV